MVLLPAVKQDIFGNKMTLTKEQEAKFVEFLYSYYYKEGGYGSGAWGLEVHDFLESIFGEAEF